MIGEINAPGAGVHSIPAALVAGSCAVFSVTAVNVVGSYKEGVVEKEIQGCIALLHPETDEVLVLNETASDVWRLIDGVTGLESIILLLAKAYGVEAEVIGDDVERTVTTLHARGFLTVLDEP